MKINSKTIFVGLFAILYLCVGLVSTIHAIQFFGLANSPVLGTILAVTFEIGQAAVLFNLLTNPQQRKKFMPWALMCILTLVQILGNIFSSYKYLITNSSENLRFFKEPIFVWTNLPDDQCNVIITYIVGAILPIVALCLTEMVVSYLGMEAESKQENKLVETPVQNNEVFNNNEQTDTVEQDKIETPVETEQKDEPIINEDTKNAVDELLNGPVKQESQNTRKESHFINI
jgi:hypothetical protein